VPEHYRCGDRDPARWHAADRRPVAASEDRPDETVTERWRERLGELIHDKRKQVRQNGA
jgi:hypothetical protein